MTGGSGDENAWAALRLAGACRPAYQRVDQTHSAALARRPAGRSTVPAAPQTWREGLRTLFCRSLARAISDVIFMPEGQAVFSLDGGDIYVSRQLALDILPASWLQAGTRPAADKMDRLRADIVERLGWVDEAGAGALPRRGHQSIILDKAA